MILNPVFLESVAFLGASALALGIVAVAALGLWRAINDERPLLLSDVLALEGVDMGAHLNGVGARQFALAARRCMECTARSRCEASLAGRGGEDYRAFCPNAGYVALMKG